MNGRNFQYIFNKVITRIRLVLGFNTGEPRTLAGVECLEPEEREVIDLVPTGHKAEFLQAFLAARSHTRDVQSFIDRFAPGTYFPSEETQDFH